MSEESKPPKKPALSPREAALFGAAGGVICLGFAILAHRVGLPLTELQRELFIGGGGAALLGGLVGARFWPTKGDS